MKEIDPDMLQQKLTITEAAVELYVKQGGSFTLKGVAEKTDLSVGEIFEYFPDKPSILRFFYTAVIIRYRLMIDEIDDFETFLLEEKLSNFVYASLDMLEEQREFVTMTFNRLVTRTCKKTEFQQEAEELVREFIDSDNRISVPASLITGTLLYRVFFQQYIVLINLWMAGEEDREVIMELTDKYTSFVQELMYSAVIDKGVDLARFMLRNRLFIDKLPLVRSILSKIEIRE